MSEHSVRPFSNGSTVRIHFSRFSVGVTRVAIAVALAFAVAPRADAIDSTRMPDAAASEGLSETALVARPKRVESKNQDTPSRHTIAMTDEVIV